MNVGICKVNITPPIGSGICGSYPITSIGIHDELYAKVFVFEQEKSHAVLIIFDILYVERMLVKEIRAAIKDATGIPETQIMIAATHTHGGPDTLYRFKGDDSFLEPIFKRVFQFSAPDKSYIDVLKRKVVGATISAVNNMVPVHLGVGKGSITGIGTNRENPKGHIDPEVVVLRIDLISGQPLAVLYNYSCHPTILTPNNPYITSDFPGFANKVIEDILDCKAQVAFSNGACGDISTRYTRKDSSFLEAERFGRMLAGEVIKVHASTSSHSVSSLQVLHREVKLPVKEMPSINELKKQLHKAILLLEKLPSNSTSGDRISAELNRDGAQINLDLSLVLSGVDQISTEIQIIELDDFNLIGIPGELFVDFGLEIKRGIQEKTCCIIGYANGYVSYLPTSEAFERQGYESGMAITSSKAGERIVKEILSIYNH